MSEKINNEAEHPDLWNIALKHLREDVSYMKLGVRVRLEMETVKSQKELDEGIIMMNNTSGIVKGLMESLQVGIDSMNSTMVSIQGYISESRALSIEANNRVIAAKKAENDLVVREKKFEDEKKKPNLSIMSKIYAGAAFIGGLVVAWAAS